MLNTVYQYVEIVAALIPLMGIAWVWLVRPWLKGLRAQLTPKPDEQKPGDPPPPTMRELQIEQTETMHRMESKLDERLTEFGVRLASVEKAVEPVAGLVTKVGEIENRLDRAGIAK